MQKNNLKKLNTDFKYNSTEGYYAMSHKVVITVDYASSQDSTWEEEVRQNETKAPR